MPAARAAPARAQAPPMAARPAVMRRAAPASYAPPPLASLAAIPAVQRTCASCDKEEKKMPVQPRLEVGPVGDRFEMEADAIAGRVMAMREGEVSGAAPAVQRACSACSSLKDEPRARRLAADEDSREEEAKVRARAQDGGTGESIAASDSQLTSGGAPLPAATRSFFEGRMGRDLGDVRVHQGGGSHALNESIAARAFTYRNHIWLGGNEGAAPSFTMAHELAHVMQQTAPGPVGPQRREMASDAAPAVQRIECAAKDTLFFFPKGAIDLTDYHDLTTQWATGKDKAMAGEVRVPNANRGGFTALPAGRGSFGYADLVRHNPDRPVGMGFEKAGGAGSLLSMRPPAAPANPAPPDGTAAPPVQPWYVFDTIKGGGQMQPANTTTFKHSYRNGGEISKGDTNRALNDNAAPRWNGKDDFVRDATNAPTSLEIGEVKFGGGRSLAEDARSQLQSYATGFGDAQKGYEQLRKQNDRAWAGSNSLVGKSAIQNLATWSLSTTMMTGWASGDNWDKIGKEQDLVVGRWITKETCAPCDNSPDLKGEQFGKHHPDHGFLWVYAFFPRDVSGKYFGNARKTLEDHAKDAAELKAALVASPTKAKPAKRPKPNAAAGAATVRRDPRKIVRAKGKPAKPIPEKDPFAENYEQWKTKQRALSGDYDTLAKSPKAKGSIGALLFDTAAANSRDITGDLPTGVKGKMPAKAAQLKDRSTLNDIMLMSGTSGRLLGAMRKTFGSAFVKVINIYQKLREKFKTFMAERRTKSFGGGSRLARAAMKIGGMIFAAIVHEIMPQIGHLLIQCVEAGFASSVEKMFGEDIQTLVGDKIDEIEAKVAKIEADVHASIETLVGNIDGDLRKRYDDIITAWNAASTLIGVAKDVFNIIRLATCAAGGLETVGIACVVAGVDFVLGLFGVSPGEALAASLLGTCTAQKLLAEHILTIQTVKDIPKTIADAIIGFIRPILPSVEVGSMKINLADMLCKSVGGTGELPAVEDVTCGEGGSEPRVPEGKDWRPPSEVDPKILNRKPTAAEIAEHGRLPTPGTVPPRPAAQAPKPPTTPPNTPPNPPAQPGGTGGTGTTSTHGIRPGVLSGETITVNVDYYVSGEGGGGFAPGSYGGRKMTVRIKAVDSNATLYGPDPVEVLVYDIREDPKKKGVFKIDFEPVADHVLWFKSSDGNRELSLSRERRTGQVGAPQ